MSSPEHPASSFLLFFFDAREFFALMETEGVRGWAADGPWGCKRGPSVSLGGRAGVPAVWLGNPPPQPLSKMLATGFPLFSLPDADGQCVWRAPEAAVATQSPSTLPLAVSMPPPPRLRHCREEKKVCWGFSRPRGFTSAPGSEPTHLHGCKVPPREPPPKHRNPVSTSPPQPATALTVSPSLVPVPMAVPPPSPVGSSLSPSPGWFRSH